VIAHNRQLTLLVALALVAAPALGLRAFCLGASCAEEPRSNARVPFCSLPEELRERIAAGYYDGRSPDVLAATATPRLWGGVDGERGVRPPWPAVADGRASVVPLVFSGSGVATSTSAPDGATLASVAPTVARVIGLRWRYPEVHPGAPLEGFRRADPRLVLVVALKGVGSDDLFADRSAWPFLRSLLRRGTGTLSADAGSLPLDPAATLTTIGTGGLPSDHGITGLYLRNDQDGSPAQGEVVRAWSRRAPPSVISALGDDLDESRGGAPLIGLVGTDPSDRGLIGGLWYGSADDDAVVSPPARRSTAAVRELLASGFGADAEPDVLAAAVRGSIAEIDDRLRNVVTMAQRAADREVLVVVAGTGSTAADRAALPLSRPLTAVERAVPGPGRAVEGVVAGGIYLDRETLGQAGVGSNVAVDALRRVRASGGGRLMADVFPSFAVPFGRYCDRRGE
jgi:hypothetical protein